MNLEEKRAKKAAYMRAYMKSHPEKREAARIYQKERNKDPAIAEQNRARACAWYAANKERAKENARKFYERADKARVRAIQRAWIEKNSDKHTAYQKNYGHIRRVKIRTQSCDLVDFNALLSHANGMCALCRKPLEGKWHFDHIVPISRGGLHVQSNLQVTHPVCNKRKGAKLEYKHLFTD